MFIEFVVICNNSLQINSLQINLLFTINVSILVGSVNVWPVPHIRLVGTA